MGLWEELNKEVEDMLAQFEAGDFSALEGLWFDDVPDYVVEWWKNRPEPLNGCRKDVLYVIYRNDTPLEVEEWIKTQPNTLTALRRVEGRIEYLKEQEELRRLWFGG